MTSPGSVPTYLGTQMQGRMSTHAKPVNCQIAGLCEPEAPAPAPAAAAAVASLCISSAHAGLSTYLWMQGPLHSEKLSQRRMDRFPCTAAPKN